MPRLKTRRVEENGLKARLTEERWQFLMLALLTERAITAGRSRAARHANGHLREGNNGEAPANGRGLTTGGAHANGNGGAPTGGFLALLRQRDGARANGAASTNGRAHANGAAPTNGRAHANGNVPANGRAPANGGVPANHRVLALLRREGRQSRVAGGPEQLTEAQSTERADRPARVARAVQAISGRRVRALKPQGPDRHNRTSVSEPEVTPPRWRLGVDLGLSDRTRVGLLALAVAISAGIHTGLTPEHLIEMPRLGQAFILASVLGAAIAVGLVARPDDRLIAGLAGLFCLGQIVVWILFVTITVPLFPGTPEGFEWIAVVSKVVEASGVVLAIPLVAPVAVPWLKDALRADHGFGQALVAASRRETVPPVALLGVGAAAVAAVVAIVAIGGGGSPSAQGNSVTLASLGHLKSPGSPGPLGPEGIPVPNAPPLATAASTAGSAGVDGIPCLRHGQVQFRVHLTIFVQGAARQIPYGIGIPNGRAQRTSRGTFVRVGSCESLLHTNAADGIIQVESALDASNQQTYTLGNFFDVWGQPLGQERMGPATGRVTAFVNGKPYAGNPRDIPLTGDNKAIQLEVGTPLVAPEALSTTATDL